MNIYTLKVCKEDDVSLLINFIKNYWNKDHAFVKSKELLRFQHYNPLKKEYNFILGVNNQTKEIDGIVGLIPLSQYDPELEKYNETWGGIWKVRTDVKNDEIGILGLLLFEEFHKYNSRGGIGMSTIATMFYKLMKYKICILDQYYILNNECNEFKIASIPLSQKTAAIPLKKERHIIKDIDDISTVQEGSIDAGYWPRKSLTYLENRFQKHPIYTYQFWGIYDKDLKLKTILVIRAIEINNSKAIRIVDVFGSLSGIGSIKKGLIELLKKESAEYVDILNFGISPEIFAELGFEHLDVNGEIIIPNYFEPFMRKNIVINCGYKAPYNYVMFKGDSDQDRPSIIN